MTYRVLIKATNYFRITFSFGMLLLLVGNASAQVDDKKTGWENSVGLSLGINEHVDILYFFTGFTKQLDFQRYKLLNTQVGIGGGVGLTFHGGISFGYEDFKDLKFLDFYTYGKYYLNNNRTRPFIDAKFGWGFPLDSIAYSCHGCEEPTSRKQKYKGGIIFQSGIGIEFVNNKDRRRGLKLSGYIHQSGTNNKRQYGVDRSIKSLIGFTLGYNMYF